MVAIEKNIGARCEACAWDDANYDPDELEAVEELNTILILQDAGKPIEAEALTDKKWFLLRTLKNERVEIAREEAEQNKANGN
jgi:hypothetical protein